MPLDPAAFSEKTDELLASTTNVPCWGVRTCTSNPESPNQLLVATSGQATAGIGAPGPPRADPA
jgi:hypothetical protein